ncbi:macrophage mannose receptor 1-like [Mugil cephalus]|uniref:macrophage mannose receptor 1-like n=1 Tax=Mugil cephalus TaxID=48193 RepID=UPI001FB6F2C4|nr:macrophage mannose receptor 1-like [Mugil cephalus]
MRAACTVFVLLLKTLQCLTLDDSPFLLNNKETGFCLVRTYGHCSTVRWTTADRILHGWSPKCLGAQGKSVGSEISLYDCDETSYLQKWECKNETLLALKGQDLYIELTADGTAVLSRTVGPNNHLTIQGTNQGACTRTYRELYTIGGNAAGRPCAFPFLYNDQWYSECTTKDSNQLLWCAVETKYEHQLWGYCPTNTKVGWNKHPATGAVYQLNTQSALTWAQADASCKQQIASLLSITDPHEQGYITALLGDQGYKLWTGLTLNLEHGWQWSNGNPYRYLNWDSGHPLSNPGDNCGVIDGEVQYSWQSSKCDKKLGYICYSEGVLAPPTEAAETGFCSQPWIPYNGHCFHLNRSQKTWSDARLACRKEGGDLVSIRNLEDQSFVISQLGYASTDELWIGLNDRKREGLFDWSDHSTVRFTSWEYGKPAITTEKEDCVVIRGENGNWADRRCEEKHGFICMKTSASEPSGDEVEQNLGCKTGWKKHGSYCYYVGTETKTFDEAKDHCKSSGSYLADVSTGVDNAFLVSLVGLRPEKHFWLGLSNQKNIDFFVWTNTDSVRFTHWNALMPGHQQGCVAMATGSFAGLWDVLPCTSTEKYICKHLAEGAVSTPVPPTVPSPKCAEGWNPMETRNICYKNFIEGPKKTWYEARDYCRAVGGDLLSIHSTAEQRISVSHHTVWIGLSAPDPATGYEWSDGTPVNFQHWSDGEPNNRNNAESCVEDIGYYWWSSGSWNDAQCEEYNNWVCQMRPGITPKPPPDPVAPDYNTTSDGWLEWNGNQYYINNNRMAMEDARHVCQQKHGDLVTINSVAESVFLWKQISRSYINVWIGLTLDLDGTSQWVDGSQVVFERWDEGQPDFKNYDENCAAMMYYGFWHNHNCGLEFQSICKRSGSPPANTTVAPTVAPKGGCQDPWKKFNSKCYSIFNNQNLTWNGARKQCRDMGGDLASIDSRHAEVFLMSQMADANARDLWIGLRSFEGKEFYWTDGRPRSYVNFGLRKDSDDFFLPFMHWWLKRQFEQEHPEMSPYNKCVVINTNTLAGIGKWIHKPCNQTYGFVCLRNVDTTLPDVPEPQTPTIYIKILNDSFKVAPQQMNWDASKKHCEGDGANLASLRNEWAQAYVELQALNLKAPLWIGLNKVQTNGYFRYTDGWRMRFTRWGKDEPSPDRACVYMDVDGKWKTAHCNETFWGVCMKSTDVPPTESTGFPGVCPQDPDTSSEERSSLWLPFRGYCYAFFTMEKDWSGASASCVKHGANLASIEDPSEQDFITTHVITFKDSYTSFWIGLYKTHRGEWKWLDKTVMDYTNWGEDQPSGYINGEISTTNGTWRTSRNVYNRPYICKTSKVIPTKPPPPTTTTNVGSAHHHRGYIISAVVLIIAGIAVGACIAFFRFKKMGYHITFPPENYSAFENPIFFGNKQLDSATDKTQPAPVDTNTQVDNADDTEVLITM